MRQFLPALKRRERLVWLLLATGLTAGGAYWLTRHARFDKNREYRIGSDLAYPYHSIDAKGEPTGFVAELIQRAAQRLGMRLRWVRTRSRPVVALRDGEVDLWPLLSAQSRTIEPSVHVTESLMHNDAALVAVRDELRNPANIGKVRRVAFREQVNMRTRARTYFPGAELIGVKDRAEAVEKVCAGEADGAIVEVRMAYVYMATRPPRCQQSPPCFVGLTMRGEQVSLGARAGMAAVADALRDEIDRMLDQGEAQRLLLPWSYFQSNEIETFHRERRLARSLFQLRVLLGAALILLVALACQYWWLRSAVASRDSANEESWAKTRFMRKMSHELRTPLSGIIGTTELLRTMPMNSEQREYVDILRASSETMLTLVQDLLDLSHATGHTMPIRMRDFHIREWIDKALAPYAHAAAAKGLRFETAGLDELYNGRVSGDAQRLTQVLGNLLSNALKFTSAGSVRVELATQPRDDRLWLHVMVTDTGRGIEPERLPDIFEASITRDRIENPGGLGVGLSIAAELVRGMGGAIEASSEFGRSATFQFAVPLQPAQGETARLAVRAGRRP